MPFPPAQQRNDDHSSGIHQRRSQSNETGSFSDQAGSFNAQYTAAAAASVLNNVDQSKMLDYGLTASTAFAKNYMENIKNSGNVKSRYNELKCYWDLTNTIVKDKILFYLFPFNTKVFLQNDQNTTLKEDLYIPVMCAVSTVLCRGIGVGNKSSANFDPSVLQVRRKSRRVYFGSYAWRHLSDALHCASSR